MALTATVRWELQPSGTYVSDSNPGGFDPTVSGGVDYTYGAGQKTITFNGGTITASNGAAGATITINGGYTVVAGDAGNTLKITGGTNFTAGIYLISSVNTGANTWTLDRNCTTAAGSAMTGVCGGAVATPGQMAGNLALTGVGTAGQIVNVQAGTYTLAGGTVNTSGQKVSTGVAGVVWRGYQTTHGDGGTKPLLQAGANSMTIFATANFDIVIDNFEFGLGGHTTILGLSLGNGRNIARNIKLTSLDNGGIAGAGANCSVEACEASGITGGAGGAFRVTGGGCRYLGNRAHGCSIVGFAAAAGDVFIENMADGNTANGFVAASCVVYTRNFAYNNTGGSTQGFADGVNTNVRHYGDEAYGNGQYDFSNAAATVSGVLVNCAGATVNGTYLINSGFQTLTSDPTVNGAGGNYAPNTTAGAGALVRGNGWPATWPGLSSTTSSPDIGPVQHADPATTAAFPPVGLAPGFIRGALG